MIDEIDPDHPATVLERMEIVREIYFDKTGDTMIKRITDDLILEFVDYLDEYIGFVASLPQIAKNHDSEYIVIDNNSVINKLSPIVIYEHPLSPKLMLNPNINEQFVLRSPQQWIDESAVFQLRRISPKESRGRVRRILPHMYEFSRSRHKKAHSNFSTYLGFLPDSNTNIDISNGVDNTTMHSNNHLRHMRLLLSTVDAMSHHWSALFRIPGTHASIKIPIDRRLAYRLFKHREIGDGRKRRASLKHLVSEHWRTIDDVSDEVALETYVREHLRGHDFFEWFDLECAIVPSLYDRVRLKYLEIEREKIKLGGNDRRLSIATV